MQVQSVGEAQAGFPATIAFSSPRIFYAFSQMAIEEILLGARLAEVGKWEETLSEYKDRVTSGILLFIEVIYAHETFFLFFLCTQ